MNKEFEWLKEADFQDAKFHLTIIDGKEVLVWEDGIWKNGVWKNGIWIKRYFCPSFKRCGFYKLG